MVLLLVKITSLPRLQWELVCVGIRSVRDSLSLLIIVKLVQGDGWALAITSLICTDYLTAVSITCIYVYVLGHATFVHIAESKSFVVLVKYVEGGDFRKDLIRDKIDRMSGIVALIFSIYYEVWYLSEHQPDVTSHHDIELAENWFSLLWHLVQLIHSRQQIKADSQDVDEDL